MLRIIRVSVGSCLGLIAIGLAAMTVGGDAQERRPHGRLFPPEDLGSLEGPDRAAWQQPERVMDSLGITDGATVADLGAGGPGPPLEERITPDQVILEAERAGLHLIAHEEFLAYQFLLIFGRSEPSREI